MARRSRLVLPSWCALIFTILLNLLQVPSACSVPLYVRSPSPRAAFVALVSENQLDQMVESVTQLEQRFNSKYRYDWVFFSFEELSEDFKDATSNATTGTVTYNLITQQHCSVSRQAEMGRSNAVDTGTAQTQVSHHSRRWSAGPFAREKRLQAYDWFWMVEPGTQFMCDINLDIFRLMRDHGITYGFNEMPSQDEENSKQLWQSTKYFMAKHPELVRPAADITWILTDGGNLSEPSFSSEYHVGQKEEVHIDQDLDFRTQACRRGGSENEGSVCPGVSHEADDEQYNSHSTIDANVPRLASNYEECAADTRIEVGSLDHFRSLQHTSYFDYLDNAGEFYDGNPGDLNVHSLSASMFLPREKLWLFGDMAGEMNSLHSRPLLSRPVSHSDVVHDSTSLADILGSSWFHSPDGSHLSIIHRLWANMASGIARQNGFPAAQTGHTALDERNFKIYKPERYPVDVKLGWYSLEDTWRSWAIDRAKQLLALLGW
ncbi:glycolipid 2-alpha-mannosyltransferase [Colletotrichum graminicola]|uniref:Glycolipid 2-alpha-mannosyltransferase n=1 Tax=Colletotrichum graminicola (strain M1.001 / M2 / FGSC 10212) TaxID=645133 RepID=E3QX99_COLGM|nr:glycolipid 2-alpha-mannosyltransferase [Colletotrichum graminicola M1.001]EFQ35487.1 glycolipid 2-alpha-mannosyltransferase [Colletotrichum graminicola M1.001]WDK08769.1 glycolipid 2-alpha-mannosyltransferase [Colletotrichum graminicola]